MRRSPTPFACLALTCALACGAAYGAADTHLGVPPEDLVTLWGQCPGSVDPPPPPLQPLKRILPDGTLTTVFTVPQGMQFVITDVQWLARELPPIPPPLPPISKQFLLVLLPAGANPADQVVAYRSEDTTNEEGYASGADHLTAGLVLNQGFTFDANDVTKDRVIASFGTPPPTFCDVTIRGYLLDNPAAFKKK